MTSSGQEAKPSPACVREAETPCPGEGGWGCGDWFYPGNEGPPSHLLHCPQLPVRVPTSSSAKGRFREDQIRGSFEAKRAHIPSLPEKHGHRVEGECQWARPQGFSPPGGLWAQGSDFTSHTSASPSVHRREEICETTELL